MHTWARLYISKAYVAVGIHTLPGQLSTAFGSAYAYSKVSQVEVAFTRSQRQHACAVAFNGFIADETARRAAILGQVVLKSRCFLVLLERAERLVA